MAKDISAKRTENGWYTVIDGEVGSKRSSTEAKALDHGAKVVAGLARWEPIQETVLHRLNTEASWNTKEGSLLRGVSAAGVGRTSLPRRLR